MKSTSTSVEQILFRNASGHGSEIPNKGWEAALEDGDLIADAINDADMLFIIAGMGGSTGTGAALVVARIAKKLGIITVAVVTTPFIFEGKKRMSQTQAGLDALSTFVDSLLVIPNEKVFELLGEDVLFPDAFKAINDVLYTAVASIVEVINYPGLVNVDFADVRALMSEKGMAMVGSAHASGLDRATTATKHALFSKFLGDGNLASASGILMNITASMSLKMKEYYDVMETIKEFAAEDATVVVGTVINENMGDELRVTIVAFGVNGRRMGRQQMRSAEVEVLQMKDTVAEADRKIQMLKKQLETASGVDRAKLEQKLAQERSQREAADEKRIEVEKKLAIQEAEITRLKTDLMGRVQQSIQALKNSLETTDGNIKSNKRWSMALKLSALICFLSATLALLWVMAGLLLPSMGMKDGLLATIKELQYLSLIVTTFPVLVLLAIGTTLLRHDTKLMREIRSYTEQKHQIERMAGLLQSAQYAAQDLDKSKDYVEETFTKIRDRLIAMTGNDKGGDKEHGYADAMGGDGLIGGLKAFKDVLELLKGDGAPKH